MQTGAMPGNANPGARDRVEAELRRDPARSNYVIAEAARCTPQRVGTWRRELEQAGEIEAAPWQQRQARPRSAHTRGAGQRALAELRANPSRRVRAIAQAAGASHMTVLRARQQLASAAAQRAEAAWRALCLRQPERPLVPCQPYMPRPRLEFARGWPRESP